MKKFEVKLTTGHMLRLSCNYFEIENETLYAYVLAGDDFELIAAFANWDYFVGIDDEKKNEQV